MAPAQQKSTPAGADSSLDFLLDFHVKPDNKKDDPANAAAARPAPEAAPPLQDIKLTLDNAPAPAGETHDPRWHDVATKLDLAKAYVEMGDAAGAREILKEVIDEGDDKQKAAAQEVLAQIS